MSPQNETARKSRSVADPTSQRRNDTGFAIPLPGGRSLTPTAVYNTYWRFAAARQSMFIKRVSGEPPPWTGDPVLASHRFTNVYRAADRVSQYLIRHVLYRGPQTEEEVFFRALLFKVFNRIDVWEQLRCSLGEISWNTFNYERYARILDAMMARGERVYSAAYIMPSPSFGNSRKHRNHLRLLQHMMREGAPRRVAAARSLQEVVEILQSFPSIGTFLAFQFAIDLNYSELINFSEMDFVAVGPGARDGIRKCFVDRAGLSDAEIVRVVTEQADREFERLGLHFTNLWGRPLQLIDCQNVFCEVDKYARVVHPEAIGDSGRTRIKQKFVCSPDPLEQWYPPKWRLKVPSSPNASTENGAARQQVLCGKDPRAS